MPQQVAGFIHGFAVLLDQFLYSLLRRREFYLRRGERGIACADLNHFEILLCAVIIDGRQRRAARKSHFMYLFD